MFRRLAPFVLLLPLALGALEMLAATGAAAQEASPSASAEPSEPGTAPNVVVLTATGIVDNVMAGYLSRRAWPTPSAKAPRPW